MRILRLEVQGFRSLKSVSWEPGSLNVVIGPNASGKSNLLRMLEMISLSAQGKLGRCVQGAGGMGSLVWDGSAELMDFVVETASPNEGEIRYFANMVRLGGGSAYRVDREYLKKPGPPPKTAGVLLLRSDTERRFRSADSEEWYDDVEESLSEEETLLSLATGAFPGDRGIAAFRSALSEWSVYHDIRVDQQAAVRQAGVARSERRVDPDGQNLVQVLHTLCMEDRDFRSDVDDAMQAAFGEDYEELVFPPAADQRIQLRVRWRSLQRPQSAADLSDGTLRFLFLLAVLATPGPGPVIAIDEPETGLHPSMFPIIAEYAAQAAQKSQVIFTTHSPQFLDAFSEMTVATTVAQWENGETVLKTLDGQELERWLKEYSLGTLFDSGDLEALA